MLVLARGKQKKFFCFIPNRTQEIQNRSASSGVRHLEYPVTRRLDRLFCTRAGGAYERSKSKQEVSNLFTIGCFFAVCSETRWQQGTSDEPTHTPPCYSSGSATGGTARSCTGCRAIPLAVVFRSLTLLFGSYFFITSTSSGAAALSFAVRRDGAGRSAVARAFRQEWHLRRSGRVTKVGKHKNTKVIDSVLEMLCYFCCSSFLGQRETARMTP